MIKAGLLGAALGLIYMMSVTLVSPFCTVCLTPLLGVGVGYLAGWFDQPVRAETSWRHGLAAALITGVGAITGQMLAAFVNAVLVTHSDQLNVFLREVGFTDLVINDPVAYWQATITLNLFCGVFNLALLAGLGAAGGMLWFQRHRAHSLAVISS